MTIGWTQNVVIFEAELANTQRAWYIQAARRFGWSKLELQRKIKERAHLEEALDLPSEVCYTEKQHTDMGCKNSDKNSFRVPRQYLSEPDGRVYHEGPGEESGTGKPVPHRIRSDQHRGNRQPGVSSGPPQAGGTRYRLRRKTARQLKNRDYDQYDLLIGMDKANLRNMNRICGGDFDGKIHLLMEFADRPDAEVADPWYTGDFEATWQDVLIGCRGLLAFLQK